MQSEELESSRNSSKETSPAAEMTVGAAVEPPSPKPQPQCCSQFSSDTDFSLDRIKLETFIEKIVPESPPPSDTHEEEASSKGAPAKASPSPSEERPALDPFKSLQEQSPNESIRSWLQRITQMQNEIQKKISLENSQTTLRPFSDFVSSKGGSFSSTSPVQKPSRVVKYEDLPYMGEMTLDNSKPRRGRKPKKADICHLIYKNYGTIFPGAPDSSKDLIESESLKKKTSAVGGSHRETFSQTYNKSNVQTKIISSLLEKRLTQETRRDEVAEKVKTQERLASELDQDEPLNLCIRDLNQLKIRLLRKHSSTYTSDSTPEIKSEPQSDDEVEFVNETSSLSSQETPDPKIFGLSLAELNTAAGSAEPKGLENGGIAPGGYIYWPNAGVFIHPMALQQHLTYYQRMAANSSYTLPSHSPRPPPDSPTHSAKVTPELRKLAPKIRPKKQEDESEGQNHEAKVKRNASACSDKTPAKRKRSAIFIPPIPAENQTNPATEVSICKFKFTGGAKPSLQEKKMLSVDSGGNFRYYSGTGDKSMRGYEFFPREALQQQVESAHGSSTGAFLQAAGEKIIPPPVDFTGRQSHPELMLGLPDVPSSSLSVVPELGPRHKKRKSRKSLQREKLEQTFKEKGFLIQTQQLESAEGATYCKFRQLRKFTRYLFRSWKDYLPGNVRELQEGEDEGEPDMEDLSRLSDNGLTPGNLGGPL